MTATADPTPTSIVLVHGAWHGAWCWSRLLPRLRSAGVDTHAVTLSGLGERAHLMAPTIDLHTHIQDVIGLIEAEELQRVVLVGHSYAGMVITGVADRLQARHPGLLAHLVYLDAALPVPRRQLEQPHTRKRRNRPGSRLPSPAVASVFHRPMPACSA